MKIRNSKGFAHHVAVMLILVVAVIGGIGSYIFLKSSDAATLCGSGYELVVTKGTSYSTNTYLYVNKTTKVLCAFTVSSGSAYGQSRKMTVTLLTRDANPRSTTYKRTISKVTSTAGYYKKNTPPVRQSYPKLLDTKYRGADREFLVNISVSGKTAGALKGALTSAAKVSVSAYNKCEGRGGEYVTTVRISSHSPCWPYPGAYLISVKKNSYVRATTDRSANIDYPSALIVSSRTWKVCDHIAYYPDRCSSGTWSSGAASFFINQSSGFGHEMSTKKSVYIQKP